MTLELADVTAGYGDFTVLRDVSLTVPDGAAVALIGANGAGKTTLLRVASGLLAPDRGRISVDGVDCTGQPPTAMLRRGVCHVPEGRGIFPSLTVAENLRVFVRDGAETDGFARAVRAFPKLGDRLDQPAGTMSGGEQQMLALARAYVQQPRAVLLDEVSMGLAPRIVDDIFRFLDTLRADGAALLLVEQYVAKALQIADYVYVLSRGRIVFAGEPAELRSEDVYARYLGDQQPASVGEQ